MHKQVRGEGALDKDLHAAAQAQHQVQGGLLLDVVVRERAAILQLLAGEDQALLVGRDALLVLDLALHVLDGVRGLHLQRDGLASEGPAAKMTHGRQESSAPNWEQNPCLPKHTLLIP